MFLCNFRQFCTYRAPSEIEFNSVDFKILASELLDVLKEVNFKKISRGTNEFIYSLLRS